MTMKAILALPIGIGLSVAFGADPPKPLLDAGVRAQVQKSLEAQAEFAALVKGKKKVVASTMLQYREKSEIADSESEFVESLHFSYDDNKTIRSLFDQTQKRLVKVEQLDAYPTPLAAEEIADATAIAKTKDDKAKSLVEKYPLADLRVSTLCPVFSEKKNALYGKRVAIVKLSPEKRPADAVSVTVNLTDGTVVNP